MDAQMIKKSFPNARFTKTSTGCSERDAHAPLVRAWFGGPSLSAERNADEALRMCVESGAHAKRIGPRELLIDSNPSFEHEHFSPLLASF